MDRRTLLRTAVATLLAVPLVSFGQQTGKVPRIGLLMSETLPAQASRVEALRIGLRDHGYVEGKNIAIEMRSAGGDYDRLPELAAELAKLKVDVIVAFGGKAGAAAKRATTTIPIVDPVIDDPIALGASSYARPAGNLTGSAQFSPESAAKRLELLREVFPRITRVAVLINPASTGSAPQLQAMQATANALKFELQVIEVRTAREIGAALAAMAQRRIEAIVAPTETLFRANAIEIAEFAARQRLPLIGPTEFAAAGALIGYGGDPAELYRHAAYFVDRILKGAKPADLPIEQVSNLKLVINLKTANTLGITIPQSLLVRADDVMR